MLRKDVQNSLSEVGPVVQSEVEIKFLSCENLWFSDEIMERALEKFLEVGITKGLFSLDDPQQPKIVVISQHALQHAVLRFLVTDEEGNRKLRKNSLCKMNEDTAAKIDGSTLPVGYENSKAFGITRIFFLSQMLGISVS